MAKDYEWLPDKPETYICDGLYHRPLEIVSPPSLHFNPFYLNNCLFYSPDIVVRFPVPSPDTLDRLNGKK